MQKGFASKVEKNVDQAASVLFGVACGYSAYLWLGAADRLGQPAIAALAGALALITYLLVFRVLSAVQPEARALPVRAFKLREVEPLEPEDFVALDPGHSPALLAPPSPPEPEELLLTDAVEPVELASARMPEQDELLLTENYEAKEAAEAHPSEAAELELEQESEPEESELAEPVETETPVAQEGLVLDDEFANLSPNSRVVRLFDAAAMPTPSQLDSRIDRHLEGEPAQIRSAEAAQALQDALAELRRAIPNRLG